MQNRTDAWYTATIGDTTVYPSLDGDCRVDVAIVGGGLSGVASAVELSERGFKVALLEANRIGWGATGRNGGQVTGSLSGDVAMLRQLQPVMGAEADDYVWNLRWRGHRIIKQRVERYGIECDLKSGHLHAAWKPSHMPELQATYEEACQRGMESEIELLDVNSVRDYVGTDLYHGALYNRRNLHLHSLNLCLGEARAAVELGAKIFEGTEVLNIVHGETPVVETTTGRVTADAVILTGNAYHRLERKKLGGLLFPAVLANLATAPLGDELAQAINPHDLAVYDTRFVLDYYRLTADNRLMFGGGANYSGKNLSDVAGLLRPAIEKTFPQLRGCNIDYEWTGQAGITINRIPQIGRLSPSVYYAQGYSGHGIATSHILAEVLAETISGSLEEFDRLSGLKPVRIPLGERFGQSLLTLGMHYYQTLERFR